MVEKERQRTRRTTLDEAHTRYEGRRDRDKGRPDRVTGVAGHHFSASRELAPSRSRQQIVERPNWLENIALHLVWLREPVDF
ncbi:hypothetical protein K2173_008526 [Erythroxylum novogranatense]|uniref:Uncharacterized protein n=1 Tax=Erythroxylum novogranatense TaxID=1862640 RepID=A0AAV8SLB0_9ROSI|nr:hypothetical protein K2173_008526 [Erythroxylum novogranatense]